MKNNNWVLNIRVGDCPPKVKCNKIFNICQFPDMSAANGLIGDMWNITFVRNFGEEEVTQWKIVKNSIVEVELNDDLNKVVWCLEKSGLFRQMVFGGVICRKI